jgi:hypothetical protein
MRKRFTVFEDFLNFFVDPAALVVELTLRVRDSCIVTIGVLRRVAA